MKINLPSLLITCEVRGDTRRYRSLHLVEQLNFLGITCCFLHLADLSQVDPAVFRWDMIVFQRAAYGQRIRKLMDYYMRRGTVIFSDFDDLIFDIGMFQHINSPDFVDPIRSYLYKKTMQNIHTTLQRSEGSLASTEYLAARIREEGKPAWVHRNAFSLEMLRAAENARLEKKRHLKRNTLVIGYASGTPTHNRDFEMIKPALLEVMRKHPQVELHLVGPLDVGEGWGTLSERIRHFPLVPWRDLPFLLAGFDLNLAPLVMDNPFAQSKSEIKWMEAAMVETPTIASPTDAFRFAIRHQENGWLAETGEDWKNGLDALIQDHSLRENLARQAYDDVHRHYHPAKRAEDLAKTLNEIFMALRGRPFFPGDIPTREEMMDRIEERGSGHEWVPAKYERDPSYFKLGFYALRNRGVKSLLMSAWVWFRRMIAPIFPFRKL